MSKLLNDMRHPLSGTVLINGKKITINGIRGAGASSICYDVFTEDTKHMRILKQFYPDPRLFGVRIELNGTDLEIDGYDEIPELQELGKRFEDAYEIQNQLSNGKAMYSVVKTDWYYSTGATKYAMYEANWDTTTLYECMGGTLFEKLQQCLQLAEALNRIHKEGILYIDLKPENVLWDPENKRIKLFDFDAAIDTRKLASIHELRASSAFWVAPEIRSIQSFDQDKSLFLNAVSGAKTDMFSLGCMIFRYLFGENPTIEEEQSCNISQRLNKLINGSTPWRGVFSEQESILFQKIITHSIAYNRRGRYASCEELIRDLKCLIQSMQLGKRKKYPVTQESLWLLSAHLLDRHPLFQFAAKTDGDGQALDAVIVGSSPIRDAIFKNIFACAQMPDAELNIRFVAKDAADYLQQLLHSCPLLDSTTNIYLNGCEKHKSRNKEIAPTPLANLWFYESEDFAETAVEGPVVLDIYSAAPMPRYYLLVSENYDVNLEAARHIIRAAKMQAQPTFVGYLDERGDGFDLRKIGYSRLPRNICFAPFANNVKFTTSEHKFKLEVERKAFAVHSYYTKQYSERISLPDLKNDFLSGGDGYNYRSSVRSALSIPYKLHSCNIGYDDENAGLRFYREVLSQPEKAGKDSFSQKRRMIWTEHRSWLAFMITEGWSRPSQADLEQYAFRPGYNHRDKKRKLHPCICASSIDAPLLRDKFSKQQWDSITTEETKTLDPLDQMSVKLHQFCNMITDNHRDLTKLFIPLTAALQNEPNSEDLLADKDYLLELAARMKRGEPNINFVWQRFCSIFSAKLKTMGFSRACEELSQIEDEMRIVVERNKYNDYKAIDEEILEAIPFILLRKPVRRIYKLYSVNDWENILSTILLEPEELIVLSDSSLESDSLAKWHTFLDNRGLGHVVINTKTVSEIRAVQVPSVLDITGSTPELVYDALSAKPTAGLPIISCKDGKVFSPSGYAEIAFCAKKRSLTVDETLRLLEAQTPTLSQNKLTGLRGTYQQIWNVYNEAKRIPNCKGKEGRSSFPWKIFTEFVAGVERSRYQPLFLGAESELRTVYTNPVERHLVGAYKISIVLDDLQTAGIIKAYTIPEEDGEGIRISTTYPDIAAKINTLYETACMNQVSFELMTLWNEPLGGKPFDSVRYYIYQSPMSNLTMQATISRRTETSIGKKNTDQFDNIEVIERILKLLSKASANEKPLVTQCSKTIPFVQASGDDKFIVSFKFLNQAVKECFLKEGNALEAYTYHTIRERGLFNDYKMNVEFVWNASSKEEFHQYGAITNEVDVIGTKGIQSFFISCKQCELKNEHLMEIRYLADRFGVNARAMIVCSHISTDQLTPESAIVRRAKSMGISIIPARKINDASFAAAIQSASKKKDFGGLI